MSWSWSIESWFDVSLNELYSFSRCNSFWWYEFWKNKWFIYSDINASSVLMMQVILLEFALTHHWRSSLIDFSWCHIASQVWLLLPILSIVAEGSWNLTEKEWLLVYSINHIFLGSSGPFDKYFHKYYIAIRYHFHHMGFSSSIMLLSTEDRWCLWAGVVLVRSVHGIWLLLLIMIIYPGVICVIILISWELVWYISKMVILIF